jgi:hypothetical protein
MMAEYKIGDKLICKAYGYGQVQKGAVVVLDYKNSFGDWVYVTHPKTHTSICGVWDHEEYPNDFELYVETPVKHEAKPPLGLRPWNIADNERVVEILEAMLRYTKANKDIPEVWMDELTEKVSIEYE